MSNKILTAAVVALLVIIVVAAAALLTRNRNPQEAESSAELSEPAQTEMIVVPSRMPERLKLTVPNGFTETSSERFDKYYIRDDASIIVTGEKIVIGGELLGDYVEGMKQQYAQTAEDYHLDSEKIITVDGVECRLLEFGYALAGENFRQEFGCLTGVFIKDNYVYIITCKSRSETFAANVADFRKTIQSAAVTPEESAPVQTSAVSGVFGSDSAETILS